MVSPRNCFILLLIVLTANTTFAQGWVWGRGSGGATTQGWGVATDKDGNSFAAGICYGNMYGTATDVSFGPITIPFSSVPTSPTTMGKQVVWVKYNASGDVLWADGTRNGDAWLTNIATDPDGNLIIFGCFRSAFLEIGTTTLINPYITTFPAPDGQYFLAKYSADGSFLWAVADGSMSHLIGAGNVTTDNLGNIYISASFGRASISVGSFTLTNTDTTTSTAATTDDILVAKYTPAGTVVWATSVGGVWSDYVNGIVVSSTGKVYISGPLQSPSMVVGSSTIYNPYAIGPVLPAPPSYAMIAKFSATTGAPLWAESAGSTRDARGGTLAADANGNVYMTGYFSDTSITFGTTTITKTYPTSVPRRAVFVVKYSDANVVTWSKTIGSVGSDVNPGGIALSSCALWVGCSFREPVNIDGVVYPYPYTCCSPFFIAGYNLEDGTVAGFESLLTGAGSIACDPAGNVFQVSIYNPTPFVVGPDTLNESSTKGMFHLYTAKYSPLVLCCGYGSANFKHVGMPVVNFSYNGASEYDSLRWYFGDGTTSTLDSPTHTYVDTGIFNVCVTAYSDCFPDNQISYCDTIYVPFAAPNVVSDIGTRNEAELYPNPARDELTIKVHGAVYSSFTIVNVLGQSVLSAPITLSATNVNVNTLPPGIYYVALKGAGSSKVLTFVKE